MTARNTSRSINAPEWLLLAASGPAFPDRPFLMAKEQVRV
jgi:hypothetical protein